MVNTHNPHIDWRSDSMTITRPNGRRWIIKPRYSKNNSTNVVVKRMSFKKLSAFVRKKRGELYAIRITEETANKFKDMTVSSEFEGLVKEFQDIFREELPDELPPQRDLDFEINTKTDEPPLVRPVIRLSHEELKELKSSSSIC